MLATAEEETRDIRPTSIAEQTTSRQQFHDKIKIYHYLARHTCFFTRAYAFFPGLLEGSARMRA